MKKLIVIIVLISSIKSFSQETLEKKVENIPSKDNTVYEEVDKQPEYPGGIHDFRQKFSQTFDHTKIDNSGRTKSEVQFVINEDGNVTEIKTIGSNKSMNKEMERTIKVMSKRKWSPAEINGKPVKYRFKLPLTIN